MEGQIKVIRSKLINESNTTIEASNSENPVSQQTDLSVDSPSKALEVLSNQPTLDALKGALVFLSPGDTAINDFHIGTPSILASQITNTLVNQILPSYWNIFQGSPSLSQDQTLFVRCLRNVGGIKATLTRIRSLIAESEQHASTRESVLRGVEEALAVLTALLAKDDLGLRIWQDINSYVHSSSQRVLLWKEFVALTASGKILATAAQAQDALRGSKEPFSETWVSKGDAFARWLGRNIVVMLVEADLKDQINWGAITDIFIKCLSFGYSEHLIGEIYAFISMDKRNMKISYFRDLIGKLALYQQLHVLESTISVITRQCSSSKEGDEGSMLEVTPARVVGSSALLSELIYCNENLKDGLLSWLTRLSGAGVGEHVDVRRAVLAVLSSDEERLHNVVEKSFQQFGDQLYIKHTPVLHQEVATQALLLACGYLHRLRSDKLVSLARSSLLLKAMSNRIGASSPKARFLGMVTGMAISQLIDKPEGRMNFDFDMAQEAEAHWYMGLVKVQDKVGTVDDIKRFLCPKGTFKSKDQPRKEPIATKRAKLPSPETGKPKSLPRSKVAIIESSEDEDLVPYEKPDSDRDDEEEDPTLVQRKRPVAPVYIRDLIAGLRDDENYDRHRLALSTAAPLIRRKINFGNDVADHVDELATVLAGLRDKFEFENFEHMRQQGMIALVLAQPQKMGQWFSRAFFEGDYSLAQRAAILTTLGLSARELAGLSEETDNTTASKDVSAESFPSKRLPDKLHQLYATDKSPVETVAQRLQHAMMQPLALEAADKISGPNALKVRTFSSRMEVEKKRKKPIANQFAKMVAESFFFPLTGRWWRNLQAYGADNVYFSPTLLPLFLKTLAILFHASGPSALALSQMTSEFWDMLLSLRAEARAEAVVLEAVLFALLTLLEVNEDKQRLVEDHPKELLETQEWAERVFDSIEGQDEEGGRVKMLAAGLLLRCREVVEKYQRRLLGHMVD